MNSIESYNKTMVARYYECKMETERKSLGISAFTIIFLQAKHAGAAMLTC